MGVAKIIIVWVSCLVIAFLTYRFCAAYIVANTNVDASLQLWSGNSRALENKQTRQLLSAVAIPNENQNLDYSQNILKAAPLSSAVFFNYAWFYSKRLDEQRLRDVLEMAKLRNPRNQNVLKMLSQRTLQNGELDKAIENLHLLMVIAPDDQKEYYPLLDMLYNKEVASAAILEKIHQNEIWVEKFILYQIRLAEKTNILGVLNSVNSYILSEFVPEGKKKNIKEKYLMKTVRLGEIDIAYNLWKSWRRPSFVESTPFDPMFKDETALPPFNWSFNHGYNGIVVERNQIGGFFSSFSDTVPRKIISQIMFLEEKQISHISFDASWDYTARQGYFEWRAYCSVSRKLIARLPINYKLNDKHSKTFPFPIDSEGCDYLTLELWGIPGVIPGRIVMTVNSVELTLERQSLP